MRKSIFAPALVLSFFLFYSAFGAGTGVFHAYKAHAERGDNGNNSEMDQSNESSSGDAEMRSQNSGDDAKGNDNAKGNEEIDKQESSSSKESDEQEVELEKGDSEIESTSSLEKSIHDREDKLDSEASSTENKDKQEALNDHDQMRLAVHALLSSKTLLGGIGEEVSVLAQNLNNSVTSTLSEEVKIKSRGWLTRLFFGADRENAASLMGQVNQNKETIQKLNQLIASCGNCSQDIKAMLQNQLTLAEDEQTHLEALAKDAQDSVGIFGAILKLFGR